MLRRGARDPGGELHVVQLPVAVGVRRREDGLHLRSLGAVEAQVGAPQGGWGRLGIHQATPQGAQHGVIGIFWRPK